MAYENLTAPAAGALLPVDAVAGAKFPRTKVSFGAEGAAVDVSSANPLPVALTGVATDATLVALSAKLPASVGAKAISGSLSITPATAAEFPLGAAENYVGKLGGDILSASQSPAVSTTPYIAGDVVGTILTFASIVRIAAGIGLVQAASVFSKSAQTVAMDLILFSASPTASNPTDNAPFVLHASDYAKRLGAIPITSWTAMGGPCLAENVARGLPVRAVAANTIFGVLVVRGAMTLASVSDISVDLSVLPG